MGAGLSPPARTLSLSSLSLLVPLSRPGWEASPRRQGTNGWRGRAVLAPSCSARATAPVLARRPGGHTHSAGSSPTPGARPGAAATGPQPSRGSGRRLPGAPWWPSARRRATSGPPVQARFSRQAGKFRHNFWGQSLSVMLIKHKETRYIFSFPLGFFLTSPFGTTMPRLNDFWRGL